jgi:GAF domain-containing protein
VPNPLRDSLAAATSELLSVLIATPSVDAFLDQAAVLAAGVVSPPAACGITYHNEGEPFTVATSDELAGQVDEIQYRSGEGPCLTAMYQNRAVEVDDLSQETRWDAYRPHALAHGVACSLSFPLAIGDRAVGALNLYSTRPNAFNARDREHAEAFTSQVSAALVLTLRHAQQSQLGEQLEQAMSSRAIIDQAVGILMGQQRCTASVAFDVLRKASQHRNRKLRDVAADVISNVTGQSPEPPPRFRTGRDHSRED